MEAAGEQVTGELVVSLQLQMGYEKLRLYFTDKRIIVAHLGKVGAGSIAPTFFFGSIGGALGSLLGRKRGGSRSGRATEYPRPSSILARSKDNFSIFFDEIISVDLKQEAYKNTITILSGSDKLHFTSPSGFEVVRSLFEKALAEKVRVHRDSSVNQDSRTVARE